MTLPHVYQVHKELIFETISKGGQSELTATLKLGRTVREEGASWKSVGSVGHRESNSPVMKAAIHKVVHPEEQKAIRFLSKASPGRTAGLRDSRKGASLSRPAHAPARRSFSAPDGTVWKACPTLTLDPAPLRLVNTPNVPPKPPTSCQESRAKSLFPCRDVHVMNICMWNMVEYVSRSILARIIRAQIALIMRTYVALSWPNYEDGAQQI